jgi:ABC-type antimicrobial peptide transport system permease subunit
VRGGYAILAYSVTLREREIGIRLALGATRPNVLRMVLRQGMTPVGVGIGLGAVAACALTRVLRGMLYGVSPMDPLTFAAGTLLLSLIAILACFLPARRAARIDPMVALRHEWCEGFASTTESKAIPHELDATNHSETRDVLKLVVGQGLRLTLAGVVAGLVAALGLMRFLSSLLCGVVPIDVPTFAGVALLLVGIALLACYLPARRTARIDPMVALRYE